MKLRQLEAMRAVVASGTTTQAAELLGLTQPAVSRLITQLEDELCLNIFDRRHGRLRITPEGQHFYDVAQKVLASIDQITATARDIRTLQAGALRIIAMPALAYGLLPDTIAKFNAEYNQIKVSVVMGNRQDIEEGIEGAQYDLGIATLPNTQQSIDVEPLFAVNCVCIAPKGHPFEKLERVTAKDMSGMSFISLSAGTLFRYRIDELFGSLGIERKLVIEAPSTLLSCNLVARGVGVTIVHPFIATAYGDSVISRPFDPAIRLEYGLLFPSGHSRSLITKTFVETLRNDLINQYPDS
ncbi:MAG: LysR family transcriptional regulator [Rhodospirillales bacterium]|nr:LysR family transcriptional regulator [Rhodospirillales bacterium]